MNRTFISTAVRAAVFQALLTHPEIIATGAVVVQRERGQMISQIQEALAGIELGLVVLPCEIMSVNPNNEVPIVNELRVSVTALESPLNQGIESEELAELVMVLLNGMRLPMLGPDVILFIDEGGVRYDEDPKRSLMLSTVSFNCTGLPAQLA